ncbi:hypothetical protein HMPREF3192_00663 [Atopobium deltae]|uniref:Uncharacterized protein n=1 Tax=Atopobium deltae TaxID=1393034 RepID=A0A133XVG3_9ACTN|nr:hypothetical protein HMPREF3192_00663 [Atopobium deltae]
MSKTKQTFFGNKAHFLSVCGVCAPPLCDHCATTVCLSAHLAV